MVRANPDGSTVRVRDVGRVELGSQAVATPSAGWTAATPPPWPIYLAPGANAVAVANGIQAAMERLAERFPDDLDYAVIYDTTDFVKASLEKVIHTLFEAFVLVILVVFLFLGSWRATLIPLIAVPVALIGTFAFLLMIGFSANTISLLAVVLAIGIVVDDAIVVVENVERIMEEEGLAAARGGQEGDGPDHRPHHRHHPGAAVGLPAGGLHPRHHRPALPAVRRRGRLLHADLGDQCADPVAGPVRHPAQADATQTRPHALS